MGIQSRGASSTIPTTRGSRISPMKAPWRNLDGPAKWLVIAVVALLVSSGLCKLQLAITKATHQNNALIGLFICTGVAEVIVMAVSACAIVVSLIIWIATALYARFTE